MVQVLLLLTEKVNIDGLLTGERSWKILESTQKPIETKIQHEDHSSAAYNFEEKLKRQNISTMLDIYKEDYLAKIGMLTC